MEGPETGKPQVMRCIYAQYMEGLSNAFDQLKQDGGSDAISRQIKLQSHAFSAESRGKKTKKCLPKGKAFLRLKGACCTNIPA